MNCPETERTAAYADGLLAQGESASLLEHCADCEECRRALAILALPRESAPLPEALESRAIAALRRSLDRAPRSLRAFRRPAGPPAAAGAVAAALVLAFAGLLLFSKQQKPRVEAPPPSVRAERAPIPESEPERAVARVSPPQEPAPKPEAPRAPAPLPPATKAEEPRVEPAPGETPRDVPQPEEIRPEETPKPPSHTMTARVLSDLQITDITGTLTVQRRGARAKEKLSGIARLGEGDVLSTEKTSSFQVEGRNPVVLSENSSVSLAFAAQERAPWIQLHAGEATIDAPGSSRWIVTDGRVALGVKEGRARFAVARAEGRLSMMALGEPMYVQPDGGRVLALRAGEEVSVGKSSLDVRAVDRALAARRGAAFDVARPRQRTIFYTSCDAADAKREHFFLQEGAWYRNDGLISRERPDRTASAAIAPNPRPAWRDSLVLRFRFMTNCQSLQSSLRVEERKYTLLKTTAVDRRSLNQWVSAEMPLSVGALQFRRDDGVNGLTLTTEDKFDSIRFVVKQQDVFGDAKAYVLIDDVQLVEKD